MIGVPRGEHNLAERNEWGRKIEERSEEVEEEREKETDRWGRRGNVRASLKLEH